MSSSLSTDGPLDLFPFQGMSKITAVDWVDDLNYFKLPVWILTRFRPVQLFPIIVKAIITI